MMSMWKERVATIWEGTTTFSCHILQDPAEPYSRAYYDEYRAQEYFAVYNFDCMRMHSRVDQHKVFFEGR